MNKILPFNDLKKIYNKQNYYCEKLGKLYIPDENKLIDITCNRLSCEICRPKLKDILHKEIVKNVYSFDLQKHFIITSEGKEFREKYNYEQSYYFMNHQWNKFRKLINYHYPNLIYVLLPRAQKTGYCHYHILTNKYIDWKFLNKKRKRYGLGYVSIQKNKDVAEYLANDYFNDNEWFIPLNIRHYRSSREIKLMNFEKTKDNIFFNHKKTEEEILNEINEKLGIPFNPFNEYYENKMMIQHNRKNGINGIPIIKLTEVTNEEILNIISDKETIINEYGIQHKYNTKNAVFIKNIGYS